MRHLGLRNAFRFATFLAAAALPAFLAPQAQAQLATVKTISIGIDLYQGLLLASDGNFYTKSQGAALEGCEDNQNNNCSAIYKVTSDGTTTVFHNFQETATESNADGLQPTSLIEGTDGNFYGTCAAGGSLGYGTIFKIAQDGTFTLLYDFPGTPATATTNANPTVGMQPRGLVEGADGNLYGIASLGFPPSPPGDYGPGLFFRIAKDGAFTSVHIFSLYTSKTSEGSYPTSIMQADDGNFYVTMSNGQVDGQVLYPGAIDRVTPDGVVTVLYNFAADDSEGIAPLGPLTEGSDHSMYGASQSNLDWTGYAFRLPPSGPLQILHHFTAGADGGLAFGDMLLASDGNLYGTTAVGGDTTSANCTLSMGCGTVFRLTTSGTLTTLHDFKGGIATSTILQDNPQVDGASPQVPIVQGPGGIFYGVTGGGPKGNSNVFSLSMKAAIPAPIQITFSPSTVEAGTPATLTWKVLNAFSETSQLCSGHVLSSPQEADSHGVWNGKVQAGKLVDDVYSGSTTITPSKAGVYTFVLTCGGQESGFGTLQVPGPRLQIQTTTLPVGSVGKRYNFFLAADGGEEPYLWSIQGSLPKGLSFDSSTGSLNGTPLQYGKFPLQFSVVDKESEPQQASTSLILTVQNTLTLSGTYPNAKYQKPYSGGLTLTGGVPPYQWKLVSSGITGSLPEGFTLNASTGVISGSSQSAYGEFGLTIQVTDSENPKAETTQSELFTILPPDLKITSNAFLPSALQGKYYTTAMTATGGVPPYTWSLLANHPPPPGLTLSTTGVLSGIPTEWSGEGYDQLGVTVTDSADPPIVVYGYPELHIDTDLHITLESLPTARVGEVYTVALTATGGVPPLTWDLNFSKPFPGSITLVPPTVPDGLWLLQANLTDADNAAVTLTVSDSEKTTAMNKVVYLFTVLPALQPTTTTLTSSNIALGTGESVTFNATAAARESGAPAPTGQVIFSSGGTTLGTAALDAKGNASLTTSFAQSGVYSLTSTYSGSSTYAASTSAAVTETVVTPNVSAAISPNNLTIASGSSGQLVITLTPAGDYTGTVNFSCGTLPAHVSCTFAPPSLTIAAGSGPVTDTLTVSTDAPMTAILRQPSNRGSHNGLFAATAFWLPGSLAAMLGMVRRNRGRAGARQRNLLRTPWIIVLLCVGLVGSLSSCGGVSNDAHAGTYKIPITLTLKDAATQNINATVIVE